ncbi:hypothetical protein BpHYR1_000694 [Brachionus plicatilis]|uniref:Uncharacterized protein n=1 Tax=Brachionus plicatilis TaxID=10195 RepID=A0A3M7T5Z2_BRAPC|nr:hypothetical protein BpHYR1_000694 [Brachionus plicatilis]
MRVRKKMIIKRTNAPCMMILNLFIIYLNKILTTRGVVVNYGFELVLSVLCFYLPPDMSSSRNHYS